MSVKLVKQCETVNHMVTLSLTGISAQNFAYYEIVGSIFKVLNYSTND